MGSLAWKIVLYRSCGQIFILIINFPSAHRLNTFIALIFIPHFHQIGARVDEMRMLEHSNESSLKCYLAFVVALSTLLSFALYGEEGEASTIRIT